MIQFERREQKVDEYTTKNSKERESTITSFQQLQFYGKLELSSIWLEYRSDTCLKWEVFSFIVYERKVHWVRIVTYGDRDKVSDIGKEEIRAVQ